MQDYNEQRKSSKKASPAPKKKSGKISHAKTMDMPAEPIEQPRMSAKAIIKNVTTSNLNSLEQKLSDRNAENERVDTIEAE